MRVFLLVSLLGLPLWGTSAARGEEYVVGVEAVDYYPLYSGTEWGEYRGYGRELLDAFAADTGHVLVYKPLPVARLFKTFLETEELDFKYPDNAYWSSEDKAGKGVVYSEPTVEYVEGVFVREARADLPLEELKTLSIIRGFTAWEYLEHVRSGQVRLEECNDYEDLLAKALQGEVDGAYSDLVVMRHKLESTGRTGALVFAAQLPHLRSTYHLSSIKHPEVVAAFNAWLAANQDKLQALQAKYAVTP